MKASSLASSIRVLDLSAHAVPSECKQIVVENAKTRVVIRNRSVPASTSGALKQDLIVGSVCDYFRDPVRFKRIKPYLLETSGVSMRLLDWFVTNYARTHRLVLQPPPEAAVAEDAADEVLTTAAGGIHVWQSYRNFLRSYSKKNFDPFCRRTRLMVQFPADEDGLTYVTTAAKLNFLRWALGAGVLDYCELHISEIEREMVESLRVNVTGAAKPKAAKKPKLKKQ